MTNRKKVLGVLLGVTMTMGVVAAHPISASAASQFQNGHFEMTLDSYQSSAMEIADGWTNGDMFDCTWRATNVSFHNGIMDLKIDKDAPTNGYSGAEYRSRQTFGYGMYKVTMKPIKNDGVVSSFFTYTGPTDGTPWDEIDIEFLGKDTTKVQFNYFTSGQGNHEFLYDLGFDASQSFHEYGFDWEKDSITWYVDGEAVYTATTNIPSIPGKIMMNVWNGRGVDGWLNHYNGKTPLIAQYDCFSYSADGNTTPSNPQPSNPQPTNPQPSNPQPTNPEPSPAPVDPQPTNPEPSNPQPATGELSVNTSINNWGSGYQVSFQIENKSGAKVDTWTLTVPKSQLNITNSWNVTIVESGSNYVITPLSWNSAIENGGKVEFGILGSGPIGNSISCIVK